MYRVEVSELRGGDHPLGNERGRSADAFVLNRRFRECSGVAVRMVVNHHGDHIAVSDVRELGGVVAVHEGDVIPIFSVGRHPRDGRAKSEPIEDTGSLGTRLTDKHGLHGCGGEICGVHNAGSQSVKIRVDV